SVKTKKHDDKTKREAKGKSHVELSPGYRNLSEEFEDFFYNSINEVNAASTPVLAVGQISTNSTNTFSDAALKDITYFDDEEDVGAEADFTNLETTITISPIPTTRVYKDHLVTKIIEPKKVHQALKDPSWIEAMQEELLQFKMQKEEGIDYEEVFAPVSRIEAIRLFLAYASFMDFMLYQMDVKSAFLYETIEEEALYGLHQAPRAWYETLANYLLENGFQRGKMDQTFFIKKQKALEDITYFDDEEDVGAEADFTNLETTITISPIPTTRVYTDHPVTNIIGNLSTSTQTKSMTRMV
nr:hypothetical protein [Tanacetum cinerariifolium]